MRILLAVVVALAWAAPAHAATVQVPPRFYTHDPAVSIAITADDGATLTCRLAAADAAPCTSPWQPQVTGDGAYAYTVTATDADDSTAQAQGEFVLDRVAPQIAVTDGHIADTDANLDRTECAADDGPYGPCPDAVPAGVGTFTVRAYDKAGNVSSQVTGPAPTVSAPDVRGEGGILDATAEHVHAKLTVKARHTRAFTRLT